MLTAVLRTHSVFLFVSRDGVLTNKSSNNQKSKSKIRLVHDGLSFMVYFPAASHAERQNLVLLLRFELRTQGFRIPYSTIEL